MAKNQSTGSEDDSNSQQSIIARREFPTEIDDDARMRIKLMVKAELERSLASDDSTNREAGTLRNVQVISSGCWSFCGDLSRCCCLKLSMHRCRDIPTKWTSNRLAHAFAIGSMVQLRSSSWDPRSRWLYNDCIFLRNSSCMDQNSAPSLFPFTSLNRISDLYMKYVIGWFSKCQSSHVVWNQIGRSNRR